MPITTDYDTTQLLLKMADGDEHAFRQLYDLYRDKLYHFIYNLTESKTQAEDVVQETFIKLWLQRAHVPAMENLAGWMHRVAYHHAINGLKRLASEVPVKAAWAAAQPLEQLASDAELIHKEIKQRLHQALAQLPPQQKLIYRLSREQGLKYEEIARQLAISPLTVKKHMAQALKTLRQQLMQEQGTDLALLTAVIFQLIT